MSQGNVLLEIGSIPVVVVVVVVVVDVVVVVVTFESDTSWACAIVEEAFNGSFFSIQT